jgi:hypothetical protein
VLDRHAAARARLPGTRGCRERVGADSADAAEPYGTARCRSSGAPPPQGGKRTSDGTHNTASASETPSRPSQRMDRRDPENGLPINSSVTKADVITAHDHPWTIRPTRAGHFSRADPGHSSRASKPLDMGFFLCATSFLVLPYYLWCTQRWRGLGKSLLVVALWATSLVAWRLVAWLLVET